MDVQALVQLSQELANIESKIDRKRDFTLWYSLWFDMVGALYSFFKVLPLLRSTDRQHDEIIKDAIKLLDLIRLNGAIED